MEINRLPTQRLVSGHYHESPPLPGGRAEASFSSLRVSAASRHRRRNLRDATLEAQRNVSVMREAGGDFLGHRGGQPFELPDADGSAKRVFVGG